MKRRLRRVVQEIIRRYGARQLVLRSITMALIIGIQGLAFAAGGGKAVPVGDQLPTLQLMEISSEKGLPLVPWIVDFLVFVGLLIFLLKGPFKNLFQNRHDTIKSAVEEAAAAHREAEANHKLFSEKLNRVEDEAKGLVSEAQELGADEKSRIVEGAKAYGARLEADAGRLVEQEFVKTSHSLKAEAAQLAVDKAQELIQSKLTAKDHQRFFDLALDEIRSGNGVAESGGNA